MPNAPHLHLILNHVPVLGTFFGLLLLVGAIPKRSRDLIRAGLLTFAIAGAAAVLVYLTGEPAEEAVEGLAGVSEHYLELHEEAALLTTIAAAALGAFALFGLVAYRARDLGRRFILATLLLAIAVSGLLARTAYLGGHIRHPEIRDEAMPAALQAELRESAYERYGQR